MLSGNQQTLNEIKPITEFTNTYYHPKIEIELNKLCKEKNIKLFNNEMSPITNQTIDFIDVINIQCFELNIGNKEEIIISCNPFNKNQYNKYKNWKLLIFPTYR